MARQDAGGLPIRFASAGAEAFYEIIMVRSVCCWTPETCKGSVSSGNGRAASTATIAYSSYECWRRHERAGGDQSSAGNEFELKIQMAWRSVSVAGSRDIVEKSIVRDLLEDGRRSECARRSYRDGSSG